MAESSQRCSRKKSAHGRSNSGICNACRRFSRLLSHPRKNSEMVLSHRNDIELLYLHTYIFM